MKTPNYDYESMDADLAEMVARGARTVDAIHALQLPGYLARRRAGQICEGRNLRHTIHYLVTPDEIAKIQELAEHGYNFSQISARLERSIHTCATYAHARLTPDEIMSARQKVGAARRICPNCQREHESTDQFCSEECRQAWRSAQGFRRPPNVFYCAKCGALVNDSGMKTRFCSEHCEKLYYKHPRKRRNTNDTE